MDGDQLLCLKWNYHHSTLVEVFDSLLATATLVDCILTAEGKFLNAHKIVLSACSPFFKSILTRHLDKHPILILKDVSFKELEAIMDYMYRGEVKVPEEELDGFLKAAKSLQIRGLCGDRTEGETKTMLVPDNSQSPRPHKKKKIKHRNEQCESIESQNNQNIPTMLPVLSDQIKIKSEGSGSHELYEDKSSHTSTKNENFQDLNTELILDTKCEFHEEMDEDSEMNEDTTGTSGNISQVAGSNFNVNVNVNNLSKNKVFKPVVTRTREKEHKHFCDCGKGYKYPESLCRHKKECGSDKKFLCPFCNHRTHRHYNLKLHMKAVHQLDDNDEHGGFK